MQTQTLTLTASTPGVEHRLTVQRFGTPGARPSAMIQAALHADEVPGLLVAAHLRKLLRALEAEGALHGEVILVPYANPLGLAQHLQGQHHGRFDLRDGLNFNRAFADLGAPVIKDLQGRLGRNAAANQAAIREALQRAAQQLPATSPAEDLKRKLLQMAVGCDLVLDLHCDAQAVLHLYALTPQADIAVELGALMGAQAVLLATESGDSPFDEACTRPWLQLQQQFPDAEVPLACFATTIELRGESDTDHTLAEQDARALIEFLRRRGLIAGTPAPLPAPRCQPTPLAGSEPVTATHAGVVVFRAAPGDALQVGDPVADLIDIDTGAVTTLRAQSDGLLYARSVSRWAQPGSRLAKIAGTALLRTGKLLSP